MKNYMADNGGAPQLTGTAKATQRSQESVADAAMHSASGEEQGYNPKPMRGPLASRSASPGGYATSGIERAMGASADKLHPVGKR